MIHSHALLLTDVVESTQLALRVGDAEMAKLWLAHDRAARDLLPLWHGREIDKTDGMLLLFDAASDAVGYALAYQQALSQLALPLKARAGLHVGPVTLRENSPSDVSRGAKPVEVEGVAKATAARVMSTAMGGQILMSGDARQSLGDTTLRLQSHGHWRLKGLDEPLELFEIGDDHAPFIPPPDGDKAYRVVNQDDVWIPARELRHSLPAEVGTFVGRAEALVDLSRRIQSGARLVSVLGVGGTGKTRVAIRYGRSWLGDFQGGVWFCDLAPARSIEDIASAVAQGLEIPLGRDDPVAQIGGAIAGRGPCLLILDNFEQVVRFAGQTLGHWLAQAAQARFVVTTREVLGLPGEVILALPPLLPADGAALFAQRAEEAQPGFRPDAEEQAAIAPLVALLDGLPLAIELAAARVRVMPPRVLLSRMSERFKLLASKGGRLDRQSTLHAAFDWSWDLLPSPEKAALAQLSVFEGGFTLEAAEAVIDLSAWDDAPWTVDAVQALVDKSFVQSRSDGRFDLLVSVQAYAAEQLQTQGRYAGSGSAALDSTRSRHAAWFAALGPRRATEGRCADLDNLTAACRRAVDLGSGDVAAGTLEGAWAALLLRGPFVVGVELAESVCALPDLSHRAAAHARLVLAHALVMCGLSARAREVYDSAFVSATAADDQNCEAWILFRLGSLHQLEGRIDEARARHLDAIRMARELGDGRLECLAASDLGNLALIEGRMDEALSNYTRALAVAREAADQYTQGSVLGNLGKLHLEVGRLDEADARFTEALATARAVGHRRLEGNMLCNLGTLYLVQGRLADSEAASRAALVIARDVGNVQLESIILCNLGIVIEGQGRAGEAQVQFEAAVGLAHAFGDQISEGQFAGYLGLLHARQGRPDEARHFLELGEALLRSASDAFGLGVLLTSRAEAHHLAGDDGAAATALAAASTIAAKVGTSPASEIGRALARVRGLIDPARD